MILESNLPRWLVRALSVRFGIRQFVETGTLEGHTAALVAEIIPVVHTIEISRSMYDKATPECRKNPRITRHLGNSVDIIPQILPSLTGPTLWYLDGHWSGQGPKLGLECPVIDELVLLRFRPQDVIVVDDARLFDAPPPPPHDPEQWPTTTQVVAAMRAPDRHISRFLDSLVGSPSPLFAHYPEAP